MLIDWHGTLSNSLFWEPWQAGTAVERRMAAALQEAMFRVNHHLLSPWMCGKLSSEDVVGRAASVAGVPFAGAMDAFIASCQSMRLVSDAIMPLIANLRSQGITVGIATDNLDSFTRWTVPALDLDRHVDVILNSADLGVMKGDTRDDGSSAFFGNFLHARRDLPGMTVLLDDSDDMVEVASAAGINHQLIHLEWNVICALQELQVDVIS